jgi:hypothetical protein
MRGFDLARWFFGMLLGSLLLCALLATHAPAQTPHQVKACQLKYSFAVEQLNSAYVAMSEISQPDQREAVRKLAQAVESSRVLILQRPEDAYIALCSVESFGDLDATVAVLRTAGYLPNPKDETAFNIRISAEAFERSMTCFYLAFPAASHGPFLEGKVARSQKRSEAPGRFGGC